LVDYDLLEANGIAVDQRGNIVVDENYQTSAEHVYIAGDAYRGPSSIVQAIADAQTVADGIFAAEDIRPETVSASDYEFDQAVRLDEIASKKAVLTPKVAPDMFDDHYVVETRRCLECNLICNKCVEVCPNIANIPVVVDSPSLRDHNQILHLEALCNECGNCEVFCPYSDAPYLEKFTFFSTLEDFEKIKNQGFVFLDESTIEMRYGGERYMLKLENGQPRFVDLSVEVTDDLQALLTFISTVMARYPYLLV
jgi:putative selenate reductase